MDFMYTESVAPDIDEEMLQQTLKKREKEFYGDEAEQADNCIEEKPADEEEDEQSESNI